VQDDQPSPRISQPPAAADPGADPPALGDEPAYIALDPEFEAKLRTRRAAARQRREGSAHTASADEKGLKRWGPFSLVEEIGEGPAGVVWFAHDSRADRVVVLKLLRSASVAGSQLAQARAEAARALGPRLAGLVHPCLLPVLGVEEHQGRVGLLMEVVEGRSLAEQLRDKGSLGVMGTLQVGIDACSALTAVHAAGLVHKDVKTRNVMLQPQGRAVLMDVSTAPQGGPGRTDREIALSGAPQYMAPELLCGGEPSPCTDIYSLGVLLFNCVTGNFPVKGPMVRQLREAHARGESTRLGQLRPELPEVFTSVIDRAISLDPAQRYAEAQEMLEALVAAREAVTAGVPPMRRTGVGGAFGQLPAPLRALLVLAGVGLLILLMWSRTR
jgi:serine/threonine protein kinase